MFIINMEKHIHDLDKLIEYLKFSSGECKENKLGGYDIKHQLNLSQMINSTDTDILSLIHSFYGTFINLSSMNLSNLTNFPKEVLANTLYLHSNKLVSLKGISHLELESINLNNNDLTSFEYIPLVSNRINADNNDLLSFNFLPKSFNELSVKDNKELKSLDTLEKRELKFLNISNTRIDKIENIHISERLVFSNLKLQSFKNVSFDKGTQFYTDINTIKSCDDLCIFYSLNKKRFVSLSSDEEKELTKFLKDKIIMEDL